MAMVLRYTTAPEAYDGFGTTTVRADAGTDDRGQALRLVAIENKNLTWQEDRYASGLHGSCPPEEAAKFRMIWRIND